MDWCNTVDETYRNQLREMNELSWERFKAHLDGRLADLRGELRTEMANMRADLIKWMFVFWVGNVVTLGGLMVALLRLK